MAFTIPSIFTAVDKFTAPVEKMARAMGAFGEQGETAAARVERRFRKIGDAASNISKKAFVGAAVIAAPLGIAVNEAIKFEDKLADVAKTTGLEGASLDKYGKHVLDLAGTTRTSIDDILKIGEIGGQLGIAQSELPAFTESINKFNVALGSDFAGGVEEASSSIGKIKTLFKETRGLSIADAINKSGSAVNELGATGTATAANITDFTLRIGALPDAIKPSLQSTQALAALFEEAGITSEIAARGFGDLLLGAGTAIGPFAKQMGLASDEAKKLLESDPSAFASKFAASLKNLSATELASTLADLKIGDTGTIKVIGSLSTGVERLAALQGVSNKAFKDGTSLTNEYNKKNETTQAQLAKAQNNFKALSIAIGTELLPVVNKIISKVLPFVKSVISWTRENPKLTKTIVIAAAALAGLLLAISGIAGIVSIVSTGIAGFTAVMAVFNGVMLANPILWVVGSIILLIGVVALIIAKWNEFGAAIAVIMSFFTPWLMLIISLVQSFRRNWDGIVEAFSSGNIVDGILLIGATLFDAVLMPLQQILSLIGKVTGFDWAKNAASGLEKFRSNIGVNTTTDESGEPLPGKEKLSTKVAQNDTRREEISTIKAYQSKLLIEDKTGKGKLENDNPFISMPKLGTTVGGF
jgi:TP901 family phage tail tape measure protein